MPAVMIYKAGDLRVEGSSRVTPDAGQVEVSIGVGGICGSDLHYYRHGGSLFQGACLQDITESPRFTFMATNLQTGSSWRFGKSYAADYRVGMINRPFIPLEPAPSFDFLP